MGWLILVGMFLITAFVTFGVFANVADARRERERSDALEAVPLELGRGKLSARLTGELKAIEGRGASTREWLNKTRVPYGHCLSTEACDRTTRCVQCERFETTEEDVPHLKRLLAQELELADVAVRRGLEREAEIHRSISASIEKHLKEFVAASDVA